METTKQDILKAFYPTFIGVLIGLVLGGVLWIVARSPRGNSVELLPPLRSAALGGRRRDALETDRRDCHTLDPVRWRQGRRWWQSLRSYLAYQLLARLDPYLATRSLRSLR